MGAAALGCPARQTPGNDVGTTPEFMELAD